METEKVTARTLLPLLAMAEVLFKSGRSPEELELAAELYAEALAGEKLEEVKAAFALYARRRRFYPTPAEIIALLPECRQGYRPPEPEGRRTPGYGRKICEMVLDKLRSDRWKGRPERAGVFGQWESWEADDAWRQPPRPVD